MPTRQTGYFGGGYLIRCSVHGKSGRCQSTHWCRHFPTGIREVYRLGWKCHSYEGCKKRFICNKHGNKMTCGNMTTRPVETHKVVAEGHEWEVCLTPSQRTVATVFVGTVGNTSVRVVLNRWAFSPWGLQFRDGDGPWSEPLVLHPANRGRDSIAISNPLLPLRPTQLLGWVIAAGTLEGQIVKAYRLLLDWEGGQHGS